ncbi:MAG: hypothetical protein V4592_06195 [Bacteroidota bacterium]
MIAENPLALSYILPADVYLLAGERAELAIDAPLPEVQEATPVIQAEEPVITYTEPAIIPVIQAEENTIPQMPSIAAPVAPIAIQTPVAAFNYAGGYQQKFLVIVHYPNHNLMEPAHQAALESTIKRKELSIEDVAIFNIGKYPGTDIKAIGRFFKPKRMLLLGKDTFPAGMATPVFNELTMLGTCQLLSSYSFGEMMGNKENTKAFWEQMKML